MINRVIKEVIASSPPKRYSFEPFEMATSFDLEQSPYELAYHKGNGCKKGYKSRKHDIATYSNMYYFDVYFNLFNVANLSYFSSPSTNQKLVMYPIQFHYPLQKINFKCHPKWTWPTCLTRLLHLCLPLDISGSIFVELHTCTKVLVQLQHNQGAIVLLWRTLPTISLFSTGLFRYFAVLRTGLDWTVQLVSYIRTHLSHDEITVIERNMKHNFSAALRSFLVVQTTQTGIPGSFYATNGWRTHRPYMKHRCGNALHGSVRA